MGAILNLYSTATDITYALDEIERLRNEVWKLRAENIKLRAGRASKKTNLRARGIGK